jgi:hypothetical protein
VTAPGPSHADVAATADRMLLAVRPFASDDHARIDLPGPPSRFGAAADGLEGFARSFLLAAIRLRGSGGTDPLGLADWYADGLRAGTDPASPTAWPRLDQLDQARVEACSIALGLHLSRPWLWDRLPPSDQERIVAWLAGAIGQLYYPNNWVWFQIVVETFLRSVGGPWSADDIEAGLAMHESFARPDGSRPDGSSPERFGGWYADGDGRHFDHYVGWALHVYPLLWADMPDAHCPDDLRQAWRDRLARYLDDAVLLIGADGSPLLQGRSLIYRFATAAPFWMGALTGATNLSPGLLRRAAGRMIGHFTARGAPGTDGLLSLGWHHAWPAMKQDYSGPGSPYWAVKGMLGLALGADHPVWTAAEEPLPIETGDVHAALPVPGWLVSGTRADGVVRVINHGTDHAQPGAMLSDSPLYARLGYSTATLPPVGFEPLDNAVVMVAGSRTHRTGFTLLSCDADGAVSRARLHWVAPGEDDRPEHGVGRCGTVRTGPTVTIASMIRGAVEVRVIRLDTADGLDAGSVLECSGWPVVTGGRLTSTVAGFGIAGRRALHDASPLGSPVEVPYVRTADVPVVGTTYVAFVTLHGDGVDAAPPSVVVNGDAVTAIWPGGARTTVVLPAAH